MHWLLFENVGNQLSNVKRTRDFPGGPVVKNLPSKAEDLGSASGLETKISTLAFSTPKVARKAKVNLQIKKTKEAYQPEWSVTRILSLQW